MNKELLNFQETVLLRLVLGKEKLEIQKFQGHSYILLVDEFI